MFQLFLNAACASVMFGLWQHSYHAGVFMWCALTVFVFTLKSER